MNTFTGFDPAAFAFLRDLADHNGRAWFHEHRHVYQEHLLEPARAFVLAMGERLAAFSPGIHADPRVNGSILRIARDTRLRVRSDALPDAHGALVLGGRRAEP